MADRQEVRRIVIPLEARLSGGYAEASPKSGNESRSAGKSRTPGSGKNTIEVSYDHGGKRGCGIWAIIGARTSMTNRVMIYANAG
jgi:hypothetical protein